MIILLGVGPRLLSDKDLQYFYSFFSERGNWKREVSGKLLLTH